MRFGSAFWGSVPRGARARAGERAGREHKYSGISLDIWDMSAVVRERARGSAQRREHKYSSISEYIWDSSAVVRERAVGRPGSQPSITGYI